MPSSSFIYLIGFSAIFNKHLSPYSSLLLVDELARSGRYSSSLYSPLTFSTALSGWNIRYAYQCTDTFVTNEQINRIDTTCEFHKVHLFIEHIS